MPSEKTLKTIVIVLGIILVVGFAVVIGTIIKRATEISTDDPGVDDTNLETSGSVAVPQVNFETPEGAELVDLSFARDVVIVSLITKDGDPQTLVYDGRTGELLGELVRGVMDEDLPDSSEQN